MKDNKKIEILEYVGKVYDYLTILEFVKFRNYSKSRQPIYKCKCRCGKFIEIGLWTLKSKKSESSCGCIFKRKKSLPKGEAALNSLFSSYKKAARNRNYTFKLTKKDFKCIINKNCNYCGEPPSNTFKTDNDTGNYTYNGIDRVDNNKGYTKNNVVPCCIICNRAKSTLSLLEFKKWIKKLILKNQY